ncbi:substrate-binding domain-containing protein [Paenibacillus sp. GCM10012307]|uniref:Substrate-binding domain-containing protein n=1 Tax=Paenibacillus roseus TaxID=2798579 RepID=A0A934J697_9BACL|nr:substrate-binding domain-containing protein [Paenibacillus roseus]MBJ6362509.1 substrate-binding domain-containing protein [Paenibacillus roseus]
MRRRIWIYGAVLAVLLASVMLIWRLIPAENSASARNDIRYLIGVSQPNLSEPWRVAMNEEIREEVRHRDDVRVIFTDAAQSSEQQADDVKRLLDLGIDLLIVSLDDPVALTPTISDAYRNIPVIVMGRDVSDYNYTLSIGMDNEMIGKKAGEFALETLGSAGGKVIEVQGLEGSPSVEERSRGFHEALEKRPDIQIVKTLYGDWQRDKAEDLLTEWLERNGDVDLIFAHNEAMAIGACRAVSRAGLNNVDIIGIDGANTENGSVKLITDNRMTGLFTSPSGGKEALNYAIDILNKEKGIPKKVILRSQKITDDSRLDTDSASTASVGSGTRKRDPNKPIVMGFAQVGAESNFRLANTRSVITAAKEAGIELIIENAEQSQKKQIEIIRRFIEQKVDVIAFSPKTETGWEEILQEAKDAGIPVILSDREVNVSDDTLWTAYIGSDMVDEGRRAARWMTEQLTEKDHYRIVELQGTEKSAPAVGRKKGFEEIIRQYNRFEIMESYYADYTFEQGKQKMGDALRKYGKQIDVVYAHNDDMALGAIKAIEEYGLSPGKDIIVISIDATRPAFQALVTGKLNVAVECNPLLGPQLMKAVKDLMEGKELPMKIITAEGLFTQETAKQELQYREF